MLLVDDDRTDVLQATNGREALSRLDGDVDTLVIDRDMPSLSGSGVLD